MKGALAIGWRQQSSMSIPETLRTLPPVVWEYMAIPGIGAPVSLAASHSLVAPRTRCQENVTLCIFYSKFDSEMAPCRFIRPWHEMTLLGLVQDLESRVAPAEAGLATPRVGASVQLFGVLQDASGPLVDFSKPASKDKSQWLQYSR